MVPSLFFVLLSLFVVASAWVIAESRDFAPARRRASLWTQAALAGLTTAALVVYVAGEDDYRGNGISRWDAYDAEALTVCAALAGAALVALAVFGTTRGGRVALIVGPAGVAVAALFFVAFAANSLN
jgi:tellurite resistance protein TehA-like permease